MASTDENTALPDENLGDVFADFDTPASEVEAEPSAVAQTDPEPTAQAEPAPAAQPNAQNDAPPAWRLREEAEGRRQAEARAMQLERQLEELRRSQEEAKPKPEIWDDPNAFVSHGINQAVNPIQQQMTQMRGEFSQMMAIQQFGAEKVQAAFAALDQAARAGDPEAVMMAQRVKTTSMHPFGDIVNWHNRQSVFSQIGGDLEGYNKKLTEKALEDALKNPEFLQKALEAARTNARPVVRPPQSANVTKLPSLNRATAAADDDEPEDMGEVMNQAFGGR